jgi:hypothetical protein
MLPCILINTRPSSVCIPFKGSNEIDQVFNLIIPNTASHGVCFISHDKYGYILIVKGWSRPTGYCKVFMYILTNSQTSILYIYFLFIKRCCHPLRLQSVAYLNVMSNRFERIWAKMVEY